MRDISLVCFPLLRGRQLSVAGVEYSAAMIREEGSCIMERIVPSRFDEPFGAMARNSRCYPSASFTLFHRLRQLLERCPISRGIARGIDKKVPFIFPWLEW